MKKNVHLVGCWLRGSENVSLLNTTFLNKCRVGKFRATSLNDHGSAKNGYICISFNDTVTISNNATSNKPMVWNNNLNLTWKDLCLV
jgi:hypothetical protein